MRNTFLSLGIMLCLLLLGSCVPQKKLLLLQENANVKEQGQADELIKTFNLKKPVYTLKAGDVLSLRVQSTTPNEFNFLSSPAVVAGASDPVLNGYTLDPNGDILVPVIGKVNLLNLSLEEARVRLTEVLIPYLSDATINIRLLTFRYSLMGEISRQGQFTSYQDNINVIEAITIAGGFTDYANRGRIKLIRYQGNEAKVYEFSMLEDQIISKENFYLQPNDMIIVDPLPAKFIRQNLIGTATLAFSLVTTVTLLFIRLSR